MDYLQRVRGLDWDSLSLDALSLAQKVLLFINRTKWWWFAGLVLFIGVIQFYSVGINASNSLPHHLYILDKQSRSFARDDLITFRWHGGGPYGAGVKFTKIVKGLPGDTVTFQGQDVYINGRYVATAKFRASTGQALERGPTGVIPEGRYFVFAPNPDSLDSRYQITGWIDKSAVLGKPIPIF